MFGDEVSASVALEKESSGVLLAFEPVPGLAPTDEVLDEEDGGLASLEHGGKLTAGPKTAISGSYRQ